MANNGSTIVPPNSTGNAIDCSSLSVGGVVSYRQRVVIADNTRSANFALVSAGSLQVLVENTVNVGGAVSLAAGTSKIGFLQKISASVTVQGNVGLNAGTNHIGEFNISLMPAVVLAAGTAHAGEFNISLMPAVVVTSITNAINVSAMPAVVNAAGTNHIGEVNISLMPAVALAAGAANIGSINNISAAVGLAAGTQHIGEVNISIMPAVVVTSITNAINVSAMPNVVLAAGANNIGTLNGISAVVSVNIAAQSAGQVLNVTNNFRGALATPSVSHGPLTVVVGSGSATATLVTSAGAASIYVDSLLCTNGGAALCIISVLEKSLSAAVVQYLAASGGGFSHNFDPPWKISAGASLQAFLNSGGPVNVTVNFHVA